MTFNLADIVEAAVDRVPDRPALVSAARTVTYAQLEDRANRLAAWLTEQKVMILTIIGDAVARPLIDEYKANSGNYDASSLFTIGSGGAPLSPGGRAELAETFPHVILADGYGASETGAQASSMGDGRFSSFDN